VMPSEQLTQCEAVQCFGAEAIWGGGRNNPPCPGSRSFDVNRTPRFPHDFSFSGI
jgi:hypothetical protein